MRDNPRSGFVDIFSTHPSVEKRIDALVRTAGGHDPGPIALPDLDEPAEGEDEQTEDEAQEQQGEGDKPFLPQRPPLPIPGMSDRPTPQPGAPIPGIPPLGGPPAGPWGPHSGGGGSEPPRNPSLWPKR